MMNTAMNEMIDVYLLAGSEELSREFNELAGMYSDFHKDVYGFRPRHMALCACDYADEAELSLALETLKVEFARVERASIEVFARERLEQEKAIADFEQRIAQSIFQGAADRTTAIRWICQAYDVENAPGTWGWERLEYELGIPYGYIEGKPNKYG